MKNRNMAKIRLIHSKHSQHCSWRSKKIALLPAGSSGSLLGMLGSLLLRDPHMVVLFWVPTSQYLSGGPHSDQRNSVGTKIEWKEFDRRGLVSMLTLESYSCSNEFCKHFPHSLFLHTWILRSLVLGLSSFCIDTGPHLHIPASGLSSSWNRGLLWCSRVTSFHLAGSYQVLDPLSPFPDRPWVRWRLRWHPVRHRSRQREAHTSLSWHSSSKSYNCHSYNSPGCTFAYWTLCTCHPHPFEWLFQGF